MLGDAFESFGECVTLLLGSDDLEGFKVVKRTGQYWYCAERV